RSPISPCLPLHTSRHLLHSILHPFPTRTLFRSRHSFHSHALSGRSSKLLPLLLFLLFLLFDPGVEPVIQLIGDVAADNQPDHEQDRKSTRLNSSHVSTSYAVFCLKKTKYKSSYI